MQFSSSENDYSEDEEGPEKEQGRYKPAFENDRDYGKIIVAED